MGRVWGRGREGHSWLSLLRCSSHGRRRVGQGRPAVLFMVPGAAPPPVPGGGPRGTRAAAGSRAAQRVAGMRSQQGERGSPKRGLEWVGRGSRKVLRIWVSGPWGTGQSQGLTTCRAAPSRQGRPHPSLPGCSQWAASGGLGEDSASHAGRVAWWAQSPCTSRPEPLFPSARPPPWGTPWACVAVSQDLGGGLQMEERLLECQAIPWGEGGSGSTKEDTQDAH